MPSGMTGAAALWVPGRGAEFGGADPSLPLRPVRMAGGAGRSPAMLKTRSALWEAGEKLLEKINSNE